jgi:hypothetical protein
VLGEMVAKESEGAFLGQMDAHAHTRGSRGGPEGVQRGSRRGPEGVQRGSRGGTEGVQRGYRGDPEGVLTGRRQCAGS